MDKKTQRKHIRAVLSAMTDSERKPLSHAASLNLLSLPEFKSAKKVLAYCAMNSECDPSYAAEAAQSSGVTVAYPYCTDKTTMIACVPESRDAFLLGEYDIPAPDPARSEVLKASDMDLVIVPGMAFDRHFRRLGHGAGYYDRFLCGTKAIKVGFAFDEQIIDEVFTDEFDIEMDLIVTPSAIFRR